MGQLRLAIEGLIEKYSFLRLSQRDVGRRVLAAVEARIAPVRYLSLPLVTYRVTRRARAQERIAHRYARRGEAVPTFGTEPERYFRREEQRTIRELRETCGVKDESFRHEHEVRAVVRLGEDLVSGLLLEEQAFADPAHQYHGILRTRLGAWSYVTTLESPVREFAPCPEGFVDSVAIDPRCPPHKESFMRAWFEERGVAVVRSSCFGYLPANLEVYPKR